MELVLTAGLVSVILGTASRAQKAQNIDPLAAIAVGSYIVLAGLWSSPVSTASMNPARSFGPDLVLGDFSHYWVYLVGPLLGAAIAVGVAHLLRGPGGDPGGAAAAQGGLGRRAGRQPAPEADRRAGRWPPAARSGPAAEPTAAATADERTWQARAVTDVYDLVVVGGGPAGSAAALRARQLRPNARVLLLDRAQFPRDKSCGDGIAAHGVDELAGLGLPDVIADYRPVDRLTVISPGGQVVTARARRPNWVVPRRVFDARLVAAAADRGVEVRHHRVRSLAGGGGPDGRVWLDGSIAARTVVGADGANSTVRRLLGLPPTPVKHTAIAVRGYAEMPTNDDHAQLIAMQQAGWPAYAWSFPIGDGTANVGFGMLLPRLRDAGQPGREVLHGRLAALLPDRPAHDLLAHHLPLSPGRTSPGRGRVLLAGDAANLINPLTGEGIYYALLSGRLAAEAALSAAQHPLADYQRRLRERLGRHLRTTDLLARAAQSPRFLDAAIATAARRPDVFDLLIDVGLGSGEVPPRLALAVLRRWASGSGPRWPLATPRKTPSRN